MNQTINPKPRQIKRLLKSKQKMQILRLLSIGYSREEIAEYMVIAPGTVKNHIHGKAIAPGIIFLLGAENINHAIAIAFREGIIE